MKKVILIISGMLAGSAFAQQNSNLAYYSSMYGNQKISNISTVEKKASPKEEIDLTISRMLEDPVLKNAQWGFVVYDPKSQKVISSYNEYEPLIPASTTKLLTTDTALDLLGARYSWSTQLEYSGELDENGLLTGNLYIVGSGDPSIGTGKAGASSYATIITDFIQAMKDKGIKKINGDIVLQTAVFKDNKRETLPENIVWLEQKNYYLPAGSTADVDPKNERSIVKKSSPFEDNKRYFYISPYTKKIVFSEKFEGSTLSTALPPVPSYLATNLRASMLKRGVNITGKVITKNIDNNPEPRKLITLYKSPELRDIVNHINHISDNALSESLLKMVGFQKLGDQSIESGKAVVVEHLRSESFDVASLVYMDGSGLSRSHRVTPLSQVKFLAGKMKTTYYKDFFDSLPTGGQTGTLKRMFLGEGNGQVFAKTGTLNKVKTLAGYIKTHSGHTLTFSLLINNYAGSVDQVKNRMEQLLIPVLDY